MKAQICDAMMGKDRQRGTEGRHLDLREKHLGQIGIDEAALFTHLMQNIGERLSRKSKIGWATK